MNPYRRKIPVGKDGLSDVYDVTTAFGVTCPAIHHAIKKLLIPGVRTGGKSKVKDLEEAVQAAQRAVELAARVPDNFVMGVQQTASGQYTNGGPQAHDPTCRCQLCVVGDPAPHLCDQCGLTLPCDCSVDKPPLTHSRHPVRTIYGEPPIIHH